MINSSAEELFELADSLDRLICAKREGIRLESIEEDHRIAMANAIVFVGYKNQKDMFVERIIHLVNRVLSKNQEALARVGVEIWKNKVNRFGNINKFLVGRTDTANPVDTVTQLIHRIVHIQRGENRQCAEFISSRDRLEELASAGIYLRYRYIWQDDSVICHLITPHGAIRLCKLED